MTITIGWWALPLLITCAAFGLALLRKKAVGSEILGDAVRFFIRITAATLVTLVSWLIYFIIF